MKDTVIDYIIGLPPDNLTEDTNSVIRSSMPICRIHPGVPSFTDGITLFTRRSLFFSSSDGKNKDELSYTELLKRQNITLKQFSNLSSDGYIEVAFQADSFPTDSFTNEYGENFLQSFTDVVSEKAASLMQITGQRSGKQALKSIGDAIREKGGTAGNMFVSALEGATNTASEFLSSIPGGDFAKGRVDLISSLSAGSRLDFPMLWKTSGFQPSYTMTIRLYNPNPGDPDATRKYIIAPVGALMLLGIPISTDGKTYSWPFIHKITAPGIFDLDPAFISNITVIKGGDQQQISQKQSMGIVDVRIDFGSLFNSILAGRDSTGRPTLTSYLKAMDTTKSGVRSFSLNNTAGGKDISTPQLKTMKNQAPTGTEITDEEKQNPSSRIASEIKRAADDLISQIPGGFRISTT